MIQLQKSQKSENFSLVYEVINLFHSLYTIFLNNLESNYAIWFIVDSLDNFAKVSEANLLLNGEVTYLWFRAY